MLRALLILVAVTVALPASAADVGGEVTRLQGIAAASLGDTARQLATGDKVFVGETITTGNASRLRLRLIEGAVITLGDKSSFTLVGYEEASDGPVIDLMRGVFSAVAAGVDKVRGGLTVNTPLGTVGVRGTTFWGELDPGSFAVALLEGRGVWIEAAGSRVDLTIIGGGVTVEAGKPPSEPKPWGKARLDAALRTVAFD